MAADRLEVRLVPRPVVVVEYDPAWPEVFRALRDRVAAGLGEVVIGVEHVGSTAVPGLAAKPIIDLDVVVRSATDIPSVIARLAALGYAHQGDLGILGREAFTTPPGLPDHHLYLCDTDSAALHRHLLFRDYLRAHSDTARAYGELKRSAAQRFHDDRDAYMAAKDGLVKDILGRAASGKEQA